MLESTCRSSCFNTHSLFPALFPGSCVLFLHFCCRYTFIRLVVQQISVLMMGISMELYNLWWTWKVWKTLVIKYLAEATEGRKSLPWLMASKSIRAEGTVSGATRWWQNHVAETFLRAQCIGKQRWDKKQGQAVMCKTCPQWPTVPSEFLPHKGFMTSKNGATS